MKLQLGGHLPFYAHNKQAKLEIALKQPAPLREVVSQLGIPLAEVYMTVVNGELVILDETTVCDSDEVRLYSPMDGG